MKKSVLIAISILFLTITRTYAQSTALCLPDAYPAGATDCLPLGPSETLTEYYQKGITFPPASFQGQPIERVLMDISFQYAKLNIENTESAGLYNSPDDAFAGGTPVKFIAPGGIRYVSFTNQTRINEKPYVLTKHGYWMRASPAALPSSTLGYTFDKTPSTNFGWIIDPCNSYPTPSYKTATNSQSYLREQVLAFHETVEAENTTWYRVGEDEWIDRNRFRAAWVNPNPPDGIDGGRWIEINLYEQIVLVYDNYELVYACLVATGMEPFYTQPGVFQIYEKKISEDMTGAFETDKSDFYYLEDVPWTMYFDEARAFHGAYWRAWYGYTQSHGCINMSVGDSHWLYNWSEIGEWVYIHDPSGETPTDKNYYGAGGA